MKIYVITETLLASNETNVTEVYRDREKALDMLGNLREKYSKDGFYYSITALEVKQ